jgi:signal peptidase II
MRPARILPYFLIASVITVSDQVTKKLILDRIVENESISVWGDLINFRLVYNFGGAMGTSIGPAWLYTILSTAALILIAYYFIRSKSDTNLSHISLAMIFGGALGNLIDRFQHGKVVDFIDIDFPDIPFLNLYRWYTFNIADASISIGLTIFAIYILFIKDKGQIKPPVVTELPPDTQKHES